MCNRTKSAKIYDLNGNPLCSCGGNKPCGKLGKRPGGGYYYRPICNACHKKQLAAKHGLTVAELENTWHPYRKHRKDYCENTDGRLGYVCESVIRISAQLEVDHIDGNPKNNDPDNLQTLCSLCHKFKTLMHKDYSTPGRKKLKAS